MKDNKKKKVNKELIVFLSSFIFLLILGIILTYNFDFKNSCNLLFDSDTSRVIGDATEIDAEHHRLNVHPLFVLLIQPICFLLTGIVQNKILAIIIISAFVSSISTLFIYKIMKQVSNNEKHNLLITAIYCLSFSNIMFTAGIETYNFATLFLIILVYQFIKNMKEKNLDNSSLLILVFLGLMSLSFTITNFIIYLIILFILWIYKRINIKQAIIITISPLVLLVSLSFFQKLIWTNTPIILETNIREEKRNYSEIYITEKNIKNVIKNDYSNSIISDEIKLNIDYGNQYVNTNYRIGFTNTNFLKVLFISIFYLLILLLMIHNFKKNMYLNLALLLMLGFNTCLHIIYGNESTFIYSLHFVYIIILLLGINLAKEENKNIKKLSTIFLTIFLIYQFLINTKVYLKVLSIIKDILNTNYLVSNLGLLKTTLIEIIIVIFISILIYMIIKLFRQIHIEKNASNKIIKLTCSLFIIILIITTFISIERTTKDRFLFIPLKGITKEITPKTKLDYLDIEFKEHFKNELKGLEEYQNEFMDLASNYKLSVTNITWSDYYYFGLGNRKKLYYNNGTLIDIETNEVLLSLPLKENIIIPNLYTIIIETTNNEYIKIYEDNVGVHIEKNGKDEIIERTNTYIELYDFKNQKYQNTKKVLYDEILFNIKNSMITPNIIVYENPWYRDAALVSMVLKQTNNTDLIKEWVNGITEIYDKQNNGVEEADNLGELLYILSTQEEVNTDLINKIEEEAERLALSNPNGYYIYGKTDFGDMHLYQNLWYKLGIESVGRTFKYDLNIIPEDGYSSMTWWSDYGVKNKNFQEADGNYPYLNIASYHKLGSGVLPWNQSLYPLSWESNASSAKYENYASFCNRNNNIKQSPLHSWSASELLLLLLDDTDDLDFK